MMGLSAICETPLDAVLDDGWAAIIDPPAVWAPQGEVSNPWTPIEAGT